MRWECPLWVSGLALRVAQHRHRCGARVRASARPACQPRAAARAQACDHLLVKPTPRRAAQARRNAAAARWPAAPTRGIAWRVDKRFWTGAIAVVTVVIAGASALPSLLLAPSPRRPRAAVVAAKPAEPKAARALPQRRARAARRAAPVRAEPQRQAEAAAPRRSLPSRYSRVTPQPAAPRQLRRRASRRRPRRRRSHRSRRCSRSASRRASEKPAAAPETSRPASATKPPRNVRVREARASQPRKRATRPARYPIHEFLAWRR